MMAMQPDVEMVQPLVHAGFVPGGQQQVPLHVQQGVNAGSARVLFAQPAVPTGGVGAPPLLRQVVSTDSEAAQEFRALQRRIFFLVSTLAMLIVFTDIFSYFFSMAEFDSTMHEVRNAFPDSEELHWLPSVSQVLVGGLPRMFISLIVGLLVPACGYWGAKRSDSSLMCCFCGGSLLSCCSAAIGMTMCLSGLVLFRAAAPSVEVMLSTCDPYICTEPGNGNGVEFTFTANQTVDCLATSYPTYIPAYPDVPHLPNSCPPMFLTCEQLPITPVDWSSYERAPLPSTLPCEVKRNLLGCSELPYCTWTGHSCRKHVQDTQFFGMDDAEDEDHDLQVPAMMPSGVQAVPASPGLRHPWQFPQVDSDGYRRLMGKNPGGGSGGASAGGEVGDWMPESGDVFADCAVNAKSVEVFHIITTLAPDLIQRLLAFLAVQFIVAIPTTVLWCLGFVWGKSLYGKLSQGYAHVGAPSYGARPMSVMPQLQPQAQAMHGMSTVEQE
eukprot:NODE_5489_length_1765_cov_4.294872.p1 GENE.NODE_5489_length_1765_cov_4.294872~~NODE_5489_length_1765_cov_4.294872.p1  ORF type:complete len:496 (+),score=105.73 NODE_5489_length_1765_cov_4.294872:53-1540(+)